MFYIISKATNAAVNLKLYFCSARSKQYASMSVRECLSLYFFSSQSCFYPQTEKKLTQIANSQKDRKIHIEVPENY